MFTENSTFFQMKTYCRQLQIWVLLLLPLSLLAQKPADDSRTRRDAEVVRMVLMEYFKEANPDKKLYRVATQKAGVHYFSGFGLLITAPVYVPSSSRWIVTGNSFAYSLHTTSDDCNCEEDEDEDNNSTTKVSAVKWPENEQITSVMKGFLTNYGSLLGFIQPGEKIVIFYDKRYELVGEFTSLHPSANSLEKALKPERIQMELQQEDTRLSGQELATKARASVIPLEKNNKPEFEIMGKIFNSTFSHSTENAFVSSSSDMVFFDNVEKTTSRSRYELFKGLGVIYNFSVNYNKALRTTYSFAPGRTISRTLSGNDIITEIVTGDDPEEGEPAEAPEQEEASEKGKSKRVAKSPKAPKEPKTAVIARSNLDQARAEDKAKTGEKKAEEDYALFLKEVKNYMIEYGRTLRSLEPKERLIVNVAINSWNNETLPKKVELLVQKSVLDEYDKRTLSLEEAAAKIELREYKKDGRNEANDWTIFKKD